MLSSEQFPYRKKFPTTLLIPCLIALIFSALIYWFEWSITYKNHVILAFPLSFYVIGGITFLSLFMLIHSLLVYWVINKSGLDVVVMSEQLMLPSVEKYKAKHSIVVFKDIEKITIKDDEDDGESVIIEVRSNANTYELYATDFVKESHYTDFKKALADKCPHLFNAI